MTTTRPKRVKRNGFPRQCLYCLVILSSQHALDKHLITEHPL